jgi:predicted regulator of Ras-like GTPase activity (Roadblock/LC7/MglB family)
MPVHYEESSDLLNKDGGLKGNLSLTNITDLLQFLSSSAKSGVIRLLRHPGGDEGHIHFVNGELVSVVSKNLAGLEGLANLLSWDQGTFHFLPGVAAQKTNIGLSVQHAIMEAVVLLDKQASITAANENMGSEERSFEMQETERSSTEVMNDLLEIPGVDAVVVVGRDGFVIESAGSSARVNIDELGASLAHSVNGIEEMGSELNINRFQDMFVEYGRAVIMCRPVGDAVAAIITPDASKLGIIRHKTRKLFEELGHSF